MHSAVRAISGCSADSHPPKKFLQAQVRSRRTLWVQAVEATSMMP